MTRWVYTCIESHKRYFTFVHLFLIYLFIYFFWYLFTRTRITSINSIKKFTKQLFNIFRSTRIEKIPFIYFQMILHNIFQPIRIILDKVKCFIPRVEENRSTGKFDLHLNYLFIREWLVEKADSNRWSGITSKDAIEYYDA